MSQTCNIEKRGLGVGDCTALPQLIRGMITTGNSFKFTAEEAADPALLEAALQEAILNEEAFVWPFFDQMENISEESVYEDLPLSYLPVRDGNYRFKFMIAQSLCLHKKMFTHRSKSGRVFLYDSEGQLTGTVNSAGDFLGLSMQLLHTEKLMMNDGSVTTKSPILVALRDNKELDRNGGLVDAPFFNTVNRLTDAAIEVLSASSSAIEVKVTIECDGTPIQGLVSGDFILLTAAGAAQTIDTVTEGEPGVYTLEGTGLVSGTLKLADAADLSIVADFALKSYKTTVTVA
jgi:hypothetical protein